MPLRANHRDYNFFLEKEIDMKPFTLMTSAAFALLLALGLTACSDNKAEDAGEKIDEVMTDTGNAIEDACEEVKEGVKAKDTKC